MNAMVREEKSLYRKRSRIRQLRSNLKRILWILQKQLKKIDHLKIPHTQWTSILTPMKTWLSLYHSLLLPVRPWSLLILLNIEIKVLERNVRSKAKGRYTSKNFLIIEIDKERLLSDEQLEATGNQETLNLQNNLENRLKKIQNSFIKLKNSNKAKKTLRLFNPTSNGISKESDSLKRLFKKKIKRLVNRNIRTSGNRESSEYSASGEKRFYCDVCINGRYFLDKLALKKHMKIHEGRTFRCTYPGCNGIFHDKNKLRRHIIVHTGEKPYKCEVCGKRFGLEFNMKIHQRIHSGEKPFICKYPGCTRGFN